VRASHLRNRPIEEKAVAARLVEKMVLPGFASGDLSVPVCATFPLDEAPQAYERFTAGAKFGKVILEV
jgi:NADPH:quinone reductase-like Zn-dependent oxidoreductase